MNWDAVGAIGEIVGAFAIVVTLLYLVKQVKETRIAMKMQVSQDINEMFNAAHNSIASAPSLAEAIAKTEQGEELTPREYIQLRAMNQTQFNAWENLYEQLREMHDTTAIGDLKNMLEAYLKLPLVLEFWEFNKQFVTPQFCDFVSSLNANADET